MKLKALAVSILLGTALAGCDQTPPPRTPSTVAVEAPTNAAQPTVAAVDAEPANWLRIPALPLVQDAVFSMAPTFDGRRNPVLMELVCAMAAGRASQEQVNSQLVKLGIDPARLPQNSTDATSLLVSRDRVAQAVACAAFQATEPMTLLNPRDFMRESPASAGGEAMAGAKTEKATRREKEGDTAHPPKLELDNELLGSVMRLRIAQVRADADVFALIASQLARTPGLTVADYKSKTREMFTRLSPTYLERVGQQLPPVSAHYRLERFDDNGFRFSNSSGTRYDYSIDNGLLLTQNGQLWYGKGRLLGTTYRLQSAYFKAEVASLLSTRK